MFVTRYFNNSKRNWQLFWHNKNFRYKLLAGIFLIMCVIIIAPFFFQYIEKRNGTTVNDVILNLIPPHDVSTMVFILIWSSFFLMFITVIKNPEILLTFLISYIILCSFRYVSIFLFPLEAPPGIINLIDPISNTFYGGTFITKDLFFSGHTATLFVIYLCHRKKNIKYYSLIASILVGVLVLIQHIHYSFDVLFAFPFAFISYRIAKYTANTSF